VDGARLFLFRSSVKGNADDNGDMFVVRPLVYLNTALVVLVVIVVCCLLAALEEQHDATLLLAHPESYQVRSSFVGVGEKAA
jgi:hypothetical protein